MQSLLSNMLLLELKDTIIGYKWIIKENIIHKESKIIIKKQMRIQHYIAEVGNATNSCFNKKEKENII